MKNTQTILIISGAFIIIVIAVIAGYFIATKDSDQQTLGATNSKSSAGGDSIPLSQSSQQPTIALNKAPETQEVTGELPPPDQFSAYEQYADSPEALYQDTLGGTGETAQNGDLLAVYYQGWLTDGTMFDASRPDEDGEIQPFVFQLGAGQVIRGWEQSIAGMKEGGKRRLVIPASVGYGDAAQGSIPPGSMLIFDVELVKVERQTAPTPGL